MSKRLPMVENDSWLLAVEDKVNQRYANYERLKNNIIEYHGSLKNYARQYQYLGLHYDARKKGWYFREWLPNAKDVFLIGDFNGWELCRTPLTRLEFGVWEVFLPEKLYKKTLVQNSRYKLYIHSSNGWMQRMPAYTFYAIQSEETKDFSAVYWESKVSSPAKVLSQKPKELFIYEAHIGMSQEKEGVASYKDFANNILPKVKELGYTAIQLMGIAEHPYYGSFGYHVSNFFAPSSRFGTPDDLKELISKAHSLGIAVIMDLVHAHFVENINEGLNALDGDEALYNYPGERGTHPHWKSKIFDYGKPEVRHFLLSNIRYWIDEFGFDGYRFDGVSAMIYFHRGYCDDFGTLENYFGSVVDENAIGYLTLANELIHELNPNAITIAEEVSGMPGVCVPIQDGGMGFDYRMGMGIPDYWIKIIKEQPDENWDLDLMWKVMTARMPNVPTVCYCESHDQAMVGDQTLAFRLMGESMYHSMNKEISDFKVERGMALHKMIRLFTISLGGQAYLNFMGNEFGHPEWIDFPREGNNWSYSFARRQWSLSENPLLKYQYLLQFDKDMIALFQRVGLRDLDAQLMQIDELNKTISYSCKNGKYIFIFNWHTVKSIPSYGLQVPRAGKFRLVLNSDDIIYGGFGRYTSYRAQEFFTQPDFHQNPFLYFYNINRSCLVFEMEE